MSRRWHISFFISGDEFAPSKLNIPFTESNDPGDIAKTGRFKGKPRPYGSAWYVTPEHLNPSESFAHLLEVFESRLDDLRLVGATDWHISVNREYYAQCNESFSREDLEMILRLECGFDYSAFTITEEEEQKIDQEDEGRNKED
ncbi:hypothetical protein [Pelagicoccus sp. SDUM812003]|uniref:hypothetical protein n=1 Tax=Pelagicoccus sp. SDUM812003 TaxID=3041267 RepID=UPI00280F6C8A|nr:hypothetical protein [Pelagicoccus sp. SDUM812003]MDQ8205794.1 hypothetical protein [Pelagicoccus sp. SDUM812003]